MYDIQIGIQIRETLAVREFVWSGGLVSVDNGTLLGHKLVEITDFTVDDEDYCPALRAAVRFGAS
ncbi:hypothetical protein PTI98_007530 [Pleurotus ostreatus]|nr:hypothetical protein PTI98_007530 [Pleurotus ostreatus]